MKTPFHTLEVGAIFHDGKSYGSGAAKTVQSWIEYKKVSKTKAEVSSCHGNFHVDKGAIYDFAAKSQVFPV